MNKKERFAGLLANIFNRVKNPQQKVRNPIICMYHSISEKGQRNWGPWEYGVTPETFKNHIDWLSQNKTIVSLEDLLDYIRGERTLPKNSVILTFDDGYQDYVDQALPVLEEYGVPSTVYISTKLMCEQVAPYEFRLASALRQSDKIYTEIGEYDLSTKRNVKKAYSELRQQYKHLPPERRNSLIERIGSPEAKEFKIVTPDTVSQLGTHELVTVGSHSHEHRPLGKLSNSNIKTNMVQSKKILSGILGDHIAHFSFPYGSTSPNSLQVVEQVGYESAVTTEQRTVEPRDWNQCYTLPRLDMSNLAHNNLLGTGIDIELCSNSEIL
ncbi:polysaccharide deacetylase family protein [Halobellus marinus]|uniref:polysaccharide deacetylase family protein n=1 Tax=Halobellus TaxID=1073986 RepID=UPI0028AA0609|nr:polysaccharide deacetylase family protein [Halobellus sp. DFY28]